MKRKIILSAKLSIEGLRMKEEYIEETFETPTIVEETVPDPTKRSP